MMAAIWLAIFYIWMQQMKDPINTPQLRHWQLLSFLWPIAVCCYVICTLIYWVVFVGCHVVTIVRWEGLNGSGPERLMNRARYLQKNSLYLWPVLPPKSYYAGSLR